MRMRIFLAQLIKALALLSITPIVLAAQSQTPPPDRLNIQIVGHSDLGGAGKGGEGLAIKEQDGKRYLFLAHESGPNCIG